MFKSRWVHIDFWFNVDSGQDDYYLNPEQQKIFEDLLRAFIKTLNPKRKFYLYEPNPHCFLALEGVDIRKARGLAESINRFLDPKGFIYRVELNTKCTSDNVNGQGVLNIWNAFCDFYLFHRDNKISHAIHCCLEPIFQVRRKENEFYRKMAVMYQDVKVVKGRRIYCYKKLTRRSLKKLRAYEDSITLGGSNWAEKKK